MADAAVCGSVRLFESEPCGLRLHCFASPLEARGYSAEAGALPETIAGETPALQLRMSKTILPLVDHRRS